MDKITGTDLKAWGFKPGPWFKDAIEEANRLLDSGSLPQEIALAVAELEPKVAPLDPALQYRDKPFSFFDFIPRSNADEIANADSVVAHMSELMKVPTVLTGAALPDACPAGSAPGTIPVGGVVVARNAIHPGMHSADVCCSVAISILRDQMDVTEAMDTAMRVTHFGAKGQNEAIVGAAGLLAEILPAISANPFLKGLEATAIAQLGTQGDGNHFFYLGRLASTGHMAIVTHHGSRNLGAQLYKRGMEAAKRHTAKVSPNTPMHNAWLDANSEEGQAYWEALQIVRKWTKINHFAIHDTFLRETGNRLFDRWWNEHNFVFKQGEHYMHAKGATPAYEGWSQDQMPNDETSLIPLNMGQPILIAKTNRDGVGFAPHGAGRNLSRTKHMARLHEEFQADHRGLSPRDKATVIERETGGLDVRFYSGVPDLSELPSAYKDAKTVEDAISKHRLARIIDRVLPLGSIMAGEQRWQQRPDRKVRKAVAA